jgi:hypothetical protein
MKTILCIILFLFSTALMAQENKSLGVSKADSTTILYQRMDQIQYCMGKYHYEKMTAHGLMLAGITLSIVGGVTATYDENGYMTSGGTAMLFGALTAAVGVVISIDAEKWMKRGSLKVGLGKITYTF